METGRRLKVFMAGGYHGRPDPEPKAGACVDPAVGREPLVDPALG